MSLQLSEGEIKNIRQALAKSVLNSFFVGKMIPKKLISDFSQSLKTLGGDAFTKECEKFFNDKNKQKEHEIVSQFRTTPKKEIQPLINANLVSIDQTYILSKHLGELTEAEVRNMLPEDKLLLNKDLFNERLKSVEFKDIPPAAEKKILVSLIKDSIGLMKEEVILYYNLIKINRLSRVVAEKQREKKTEDIAQFQRMADAFINSYIPKVISLPSLKELNDGGSIDRNTFRDSVIDKIKAGKFNPLPFITLAGVGKGSLINHVKEIITASAKKKGQKEDVIWNSFLTYLLFQGTSDKFLDLLKISKPIQSLLSHQRAKLNQSGIIMVVFIHSTFLNLCKQISEIRNKYNKADENNKKKLFRLYANDERITMLFHASADFAMKHLDFHKGEMSEITELMKRYIKKNPIVSKADLFG